MKSSGSKDFIFFIGMGAFLINKFEVYRSFNFQSDEDLNDDEKQSCMVSFKIIVPEAVPKEMNEQDYLIIWKK